MVLREVAAEDTSPGLIAVREGGIAGLAPKGLGTPGLIARLLGRKCLTGVLF